MKRVHLVLHFSTPQAVRLWTFIPGAGVRMCRNERAQHALYGAIECRDFVGAGDPNTAVACSIRGREQCEPTLVPPADPRCPAQQDQDPDNNAPHPLQYERYPGQSCWVSRATRRIWSGCPRTTGGGESRREGSSGRHLSRPQSPATRRQVGGRQGGKMLEEEEAETLGYR